MDWICGIQQGIDYIEAHLTEKLDYQDIARRLTPQFFSFSGYSTFYVDIP